MNTDIVNLLQQAKEHRNDANYVTAQDLLIQAYNLCEPNNFNSLGKVYAFLGQLEQDHKAYNKALLMYNKALHAFQKSNDEEKIAYTVRHIADLHQELGQHQIAEENYQKALSTYRAYVNAPSLDLANTLRGFALLQEGVGNKPAAKEAWVEARTIYLNMDIQAGVEECDGHLVAL